MNFYYDHMPQNLTAQEIMLYSLDVIARDIGYIPVVGIGVGAPRVVIGIWQKIMGGEGGLQFSEGSGRVKFSGKKQAADGVANIVRGCFECIPFANMTVLPLWDSMLGDRWFLVPGYFCK